MTLSEFLAYYDYTIYDNFIINVKVIDDNKLIDENLYENKESIPSFLLNKKIICFHLSLLGIVILVGVNHE